MTDSKIILDNETLYAFITKAIMKEHDPLKKEQLKYSFIKKLGLNSFIVKVYDSNIKSSRYIAHYDDHTIEFANEKADSHVFTYNDASTITQQLKSLGLMASFDYTEKTVDSIEHNDPNGMLDTQTNQFNHNGFTYYKDHKTPFYVRNDGKLFYKDSHSEYLIESNIVYVTVNGKEYPYVYINKSGKQKHFIATQIVARVLVPNDAPDEKTIVLNENTDRSLNPKHLLWVTPSQFSTIIAQKHKKLCIQCHENMTNAQSGICTPCYRKNRAKQKQELYIKAKHQKIIEEYKDVDYDKLDNRRQAILSDRLSGMTYAEIGEKFNVSKQRIQGILHDIKKRVK